ncbi:MAG: HesB/IscA family protein [Rhodomicrobium sp.]
MEVSVTASADKFIRRLLRFDGGPGSGLRLQVTAGGCSGLAAEFSVEKAPHAGDAVVEVNGIKLFLPAGSRLLLDGVTIDFAETPTLSGFIFHDPKKKVCACGPNGVTADFPGQHKH